eukprot:jgi/Picsp_1/3769/NSC_06604-R1_protein
MGQSCCKPSVKDGIIDGPPKFDYIVESEEEWCDARSEASFQSACSFTSGNGTIFPETSSQSVNYAIEQALAARSIGKVLKARKVLLSAVQDVDYWRQMQKVAGIIAEAEEVENAFQLLECEEGYKLVRKEPLRILYKHEKGGTAHSIKIKISLDHTVSHIISIAYEWDLLKDWNKYAMDPMKFDLDRPLECVVYGAQWMMPPFKDFQSLLHTSGYDLSEEHGCLFIAIKNFDPSNFVPGEGQENIKLPDKANRRKTVDFHRGSNICLRPVFGKNKPRTEASLTVHLDPHIHLVPESLVNFVLHIFAPYLFRQINNTLIRIFEDPNLKYAARIESQPDVYGVIDAAVEEIRRQKCQ